MKPCCVNRQPLGDPAIDVTIQCSFKHTGMGLCSLGISFSKNEMG